MNWFTKEAQKDVKVAGWDMQKFRRAVILGYFLGLPLYLISGMFQDKGEDAALQELEQRAQQKQIDDRQPTAPSEVNVVDDNINPDGGQDTEVDTDLVVDDPPVRKVQEESSGEFDFKEFLDLYLERAKKREGERNEVYDDGVGVMTIGIGHAMRDSEGNHERRSRRVINEVFGNKYNWDALVNGTQQLSDEDILRLWEHDTLEKTEEVIDRVPDFTDFKPYLQEALVDGQFRGDLGPATVGLLNEDKFYDAAIEYLNHNQYINAEELGIRGIIPRMEHNADAMMQYHNETTGEHRRRD